MVNFSRADCLWQRGHTLLYQFSASALYESSCSQDCHTWRWLPCPLRWEHGFDVQKYFFFFFKSRSPGSSSANYYGSWARGHEYYIRAVHVFKPASLSHDSHSNTQRFYSSWRRSSQQKYSNVTLDFFFFFFSKINTYSFFKAVIFFQKKTNDLVKIGSFKNYQVSHTPRPFELEQQQSML